MRKILYIILLSFVVISCTRDFEKMNTDTDNITLSSASPEMILPNVLFQMADTQVSNNFTFGNVVSQQITYLLYNSIDTYSWQADDRYWNFYSQLQNINDMEKLGIAKNQFQYQGVALVLKALMFSQLSDAYGSVPFSQAGKASESIYKPKYDSQEELNKGINEMLIQANEILANGGTVVGDNMYGGDVAKWRKFANSLRLRVLMKMMNKADKKNEILTIVDNPVLYPIFASNADQAVFTYPGTGNQVSPYSVGRGRSYEIEQLTALGKTFKGFLDKYNDPRIDMWYDKPVNQPAGNHVGADAGVSNSDFKNISMLSLSFFNDPKKIKAIYMTYAELQFILAEAAEKNWITSVPKTHYDKAVKASFDFWGVAMPVDYLTTTAAYTYPNPTLIAEQKYIAFFGNGFEAWNDYKRTGLPLIPPSVKNNNNNKIPTRLIYPSIEQSINAENYKAAVANMGGDDINVKLWWQK